MYKTERLFDLLPKESVFNAEIIFIGEDYIVLDRTLFYPFSGNQQCDTGVINERIVTDVTIEILDNPAEKLSMNAPIRHYLDVGGFQVGQSVTGNIDFSTRFKTMRLHSASHLVEYFISQTSEFISAEGSFVCPEKDRTDYRLSSNITADELAILEDKVNQFIANGELIDFTMQGDLRIWQCAGISMPCCGTHVANTLEIGSVKLTKKNKGKGINRIEITLVD